MLHNVTVQLSPATTVSITVHYEIFGLDILSDYSIYRGQLSKM